jgi:hypothetical protein
MFLETQCPRSTRVEARFQSSTPRRIPRSNSLSPCPISRLSAVAQGRFLHDCSSPSRRAPASRHSCARPAPDVEPVGGVTLRAHSVVSHIGTCAGPMHRRNACCFRMSKFQHDLFMLYPRVCANVLYPFDRPLIINIRNGARTLGFQEHLAQLYGMKALVKRVRHRSTTPSVWPSVTPSPTRPDAPVGRRLC